MIKRIILLFLLLIVIGGAAAYYLVPWNALLTRKATDFLNQNGIKNVVFSIDNVGLHKATVKDIRIGTDNPLLLQSVDVRYSPKELLNGNLQDITLSGLDVKIIQTEAGWSIAGFEDLRAQASGGMAPMTLSDLIDLLPFHVVEIKDSRLQIEGSAVQTTLPFNMKLSKQPTSLLEMTINASNLTSAASDIALGIITMKLQPDDNKDWAGNWTLGSVGLDDEFSIPVLSGAGNLSYRGNAINASGGFTSADKAYKGDFNLLVDTAASDKNTITVSSLSFPFKGGIVSSKNIVVPFARKKNITINVNVNKVSLNDLMQTLTKSRVSATGTVSGTMPVIIRPDNSYTFGKGALKADGQGLLQLPSELIPGETEQIDLVRQIMKNLHYSLFQAGVETSGAKGIVVKLSVEGNNPDVYNGRAVKLNINLTGDVLDFIQKNAMLFTKPEQLLKQEMQ